MNWATPGSWLPGVPIWAGRALLRLPIDERVVRVGADDVAVHRLQHILPRRCRGQRQHRVERVDLELIVQRPRAGRRARRPVADDAAPAGDLPAAIGQLSASD